MVRGLAAASALSLALAACGGDGGGDGGQGDGGQAGGEFSVFIVEPEHLVPSNTNESEGSEVLHALYTGLISYDVETSEPVYDGVAESIESEDNKVWTIKLKDGWTFHNGEQLDAQDYVDTWNMAAYGPNAQDNAYFFDKIEGYEEVNAGDAKEMSGLEVVDDQTIQVTLSAPFSQFALQLGYTAYYPIPSAEVEKVMGAESPEAAAEALQAFGQAPIGNGPFQMDGEWVHDQHIRVTKYADYAGEPAKADAIEFRIYADVNTAYNDLIAGNLDIIDDLPAERIAEAESTFGDRLITRDSSSFTYLGFPTYDPRFDDPKLRKALSMAIDREAIIENIRGGSGTPANSWVSPVVVGAREDPCGEFCNHNPEKAKQLLEEAGGWQGTMTLWFNSGSGHRPWIEAVSNMWRETLGIQNFEFKSLQFAEYLPLLEQDKVTGPFRLGWIMDYPSPQNYLENLYTPEASSNHSGYNNPKFNELIEKGNQAATQEEGIKFYQQAEDLLVQDMPVAPMWFQEIKAAHSENITNVKVDAYEHIRVADVEVAS